MLTGMAISAVPAVSDSLSVNRIIAIEKLANEA